MSSGTFQYFLLILMHIPIKSSINGILSNVNQIIQVIYFLICLCHTRESPIMVASATV